MVFADLTFLYLFLPANILLYYLTRSQLWRNLVLVAFSLFFYAWGEPLWITLLIFSATIDYFHGLLAERFRGGIGAQLALLSSVTLNLGLLGLFKYGAFVAQNLNALLGTQFFFPPFSLPIGISFYTFQTISYVVDVYRGEVKAQRSYLRFLLFVSLYHQLVAGPIVRYRHVAAEIDGRTENVRDIEAGIGRFLTGLMKKVLVANAAGKLASGYLSPEAPGLSVLGAWFGIGLFTLQIYYDFSGYSDMAIGLGKMFGFHYQENFIYPYAAASVGDFWRRWHISLGSFFRDYLYIPLGGNRKFWLRNLLITWFATGLWHGASWNFVLWGLYYGVLLAGERLLWGRLLQKLPGALRRLYLMLAVMVGWTLFYFTDLGQAAAYLRCLFGMAGLPLWDIATVITMVNNIFWLTLSVLFCAPLLPALRERLHFDTENRGGGWVLTSALTGLQLAALLICTALLVGNSYNPFLYFRF